MPREDRYVRFGSAGCGEQRTRNVLFLLLGRWGQRVPITVPATCVRQVSGLSEKLSHSRNLRPALSASRCVSLSTLGAPRASAGSTRRPPERSQQPHAAPVPESGWASPPGTRLTPPQRMLPSASHGNGLNTRTPHCCFPDGYVRAPATTTRVPVASLRPTPLNHRLETRGRSGSIPPQRCGMKRWKRASVQNPRSVHPATR